MKQFKNLVLPIVAIVAFMTSCQTVPVTEGDYDSYPAYKGDDLEMTVSDSETNFTLWSPTADSAVVRIYNEGIGGEVIEVRVAMSLGVLLSINLFMASFIHSVFFIMASGLPRLPELMPEQPV